MFYGLVSKRERYGLSMRGWLVFAGVLVLATVFSALSIHRFLALTVRTDAEVLVVEGWIPDYAIHTAAAEFNSGRYQHVFATGGPFRSLEGLLPDNSSTASIGAHRLKRAGVASERVHAVPSLYSERDRTYHSALALRDWFAAHQLSVTAINVVTVDVHARRTRLLFQAALGPAVHIGVVAVPNPAYDPKRWWSASEGFRDVLAEGIAYIYARFFFFPSAAPLQAPAEFTSNPDTSRHDRKAQAAR
jgi:uncharacterized SAM-binding protein YcdF (DUF218 family)